MKLHWSPRSPFVRKVMIVLHETGQVEAVEQVRTVVAATALPPPEILADNPLGKIPALVLDDGTCLFDSRVICEYLDHRARGGLLPNDSRFTHLRWQALGDGLTETLLLLRTELQRSPPHGGLLDNYRTKIEAGMAALDTEAGQLTSMPFGLGHIALICAIGQLDFRFSGSGWRDAFPQLRSWHEQVIVRDSVIATAVNDDGPQAGVDTTNFLDFTKAK